MIQRACHPSISFTSGLSVSRTAVRRATLVLVIGIPTGKTAEAQLRKLVEIVLERLAGDR